MAGYRPKSLNELNDMYDKTITAEKAIIKASRQLHDVTESIVPSKEAIQPVEQPVREETKPVEALSFEVDSLINRFKSEMEAPSVKPEEPAKEKIETPVVTPPEKISFNKDAKPVEERPSQAVAKAKAYYELEMPGEVAEKATSRSDERTELFDDYMKIMNDEDDDFFSKRESFKKKSKKKKHKKSFFSRHEPSEETVDEAEESPEVNEELSSEVPAEEIAEDNSTINEVIYSPDAVSEPEGLKIEFSASNEAETIEDSNEFSSFAEEDYAPSEEAFEETEENEYTEEETQPDFDTEESAEDDIPLNFRETPEQDYSSEDIYSYDPNKKNTIPDYAEEENEEVEDYEEEEAENLIYDAESFEEAFPMPKNKNGLKAARAILSIVLSLLIVLAIAVTGVNLVLGVNTGRETLGGKFIFTAENDYIDSDILSGDLVITENRYAEDGEVFAYINYTQQCFMFGKRNGSIVNDSSDVLFIAENDGERVLVLRDDTRGVVESVYPAVGKIVSLTVTYFIPLLAAILVLILVIILLLAFVLSDKEKAYKKMKKKMIKKGVLSAEEESDYSYTEEGETEDLFSTIE